jgi:hypothetical protein
MWAGGDIKRAACGYDATREGGGMRKKRIDPINDRHDASHAVSDG